MANSQMKCGSFGKMKWTWGGGRGRNNPFPYVTCGGTIVSLECCTDDSQLPSGGGAGGGHKTDLWV